MMKMTMNMLLRDLTFVELAAMLERHADRVSAPHLVDPKARDRARATARRNGLWKTIAGSLKPAADIPVIKRSVFRQYTRTGNRLPHQAAEDARAKELELAALALWLDHPKSDLDYLQDLLWAYCDDWTWVMAAHEYASIDLGAAMRGARLAEILLALEDRIEPEVADRVHGEIERRLFRNVTNYEHTEFWHTARMNWNHVCNGGLIRAALLEIKNSRVLARLIHPVIQNMTYALDGFTDDGGCEEGAGYWGFGFGHFVQAAYALHCRTGGELDIMAHEKVARVCRFPLAVHIDGPYRTGFADSGPGTVAVLNALQINHFHPIPELYELCPRLNGQEMKGPGALDVRDMHALALYTGQEATGRPDSSDCFLPDLGMVKLRGTPGAGQMTVVAVAGYNGAPHNHNDIGSFQVFRRGRMLLTDPGAPLYNKKTFSRDRYKIIYCRSRGHSVPLINGREQKEGARHRGEIRVEGLNARGPKRAVIDMAKAYPRGTVKHLVRTLAVDTATNVLRIEDAYEFRQTPSELEEAFVTFEKGGVVEAGQAVRIGPGRAGAVLRAEQPGRFHVEVIKPDPENRRPNSPATLRRITFVPDSLTANMTLRFSLG